MPEAKLGDGFRSMASGENRRLSGAWSSSGTQPRHVMRELARSISHFWLQPCQGSRTVGGPRAVAMVVAEMLAAACPEMLVLAVLLLLHNGAVQSSAQVPGPHPCVFSPFRAQVNDFVEYFCGAARVSAQLRANGFAGASLDILLDDGRAMDFTASAGFAKLAGKGLFMAVYAA